MQRSSTTHSKAKSRSGCFLIRLCNSITRRSIWLERCWNPLRLWQVFWLRLKKHTSFWVLCGGHHNGGMSSRFYGWGYLALGANPTGFFFNQAIVWVVRAPDWLSSISGAKVMTQKPNNRVKILLPQTLTPWYIIPILYMSIPHQQIELEGCLNPLKMGKILQFAIKIIVLVLDVGFFANVYIMGVCLSFFS